MKRFKPSERCARPNQVVQVVSIFNIKNQAANDRGAFQYLKSQPPTRRFKLVIGKGRYLGDNKNITAFVWLNEPEMLKAA